MHQELYSPISIIIDSEPIGNPPTGKVYLYIGADGELKVKNSIGSIADYTNLHNNLTDLQGGGGSPGEYYHLDEAAYLELTGSGDSTLHYHSTDRARANHTGTQLASTISDFTTASETAIFTDVNFIDGTSINFTVSAGASITAEVIESGISHNGLADLQGGGGSPTTYYHLSEAEYLGLTDNIAGPAASTNNAVALFDGTTGKLIKNSAIIVTGNDIYVPGDVTIGGTLNYEHAIELQVEDKIIGLAVAGSPATGTDITANGGGIVLYGDTNKTILWDLATASWKMNQTLEVDGNITVTADNIINVLGGTSAGIIKFYEPSIAGTNFVALKGPDSLTSNIQVALPSTGGTLALTTNLNSYLPLVGGTLSGDLLLGNNVTIDAVNGGGRLDLRNSADNIIALSTDAGSLATAYIKLDGTNDNIKMYVNGGTTGIYIKDAYLDFVTTAFKISTDAGSNYGIFSIPTTADRTYTFPDVDGTIITTGNLSNITAVGTIASGTWNGTAIDETYGGTNQTTYLTGDILYSNDANSLAKLAIGSVNQVLTVVGGVPTWQDTQFGSLATLTDVSLTSPTETGDLLYFDGIDWVNLPLGTNGQVLTVGGSPLGVGWADASGGSSWTKVIKTHSDFNEADTSTSITAFSLPAGSILRGVVIKHTTAFAGTSWTKAEISIGILGEEDKYLSKSDVLTAVGDTVIYGGQNFDIQNWSSATDVIVTLDTNGGNTNASTAGVVEIYYLIETVKS